MASDVTALRNALKERDATIAQLTEQVEGLEGQLRDKETELKRQEANLNRIKMNVDGLEKKAKRSADNELQALFKVTALEKELAEARLAPGRPSAIPVTTAVDAAKAGTPSMPRDGIQHAASAATFSSSEQAAGKGAPLSPTDRQAYLHRLSRFYEVYAPHKLAEREKILNAYDGEEHLLFADLKRKYGPEPPATTPPAAAPAQAQSAPVTDTVATSAPPPSFPVPPPPQTAAPFTQQPVLDEQLLQRLRSNVQQQANDSASLQCQEQLQRLAVQTDALQTLTAVFLAHHRVVLEAMFVYRSRAEQLSAASAKLSASDENRRLEQFHELSAVRERLVVLDREKLVLERELKNLDNAVLEHETESRNLRRINVQLKDDVERLQRALNHSASDRPSANHIGPSGMDLSAVTPLGGTADATALNHLTTSSPLFDPPHVTSPGHPYAGRQGPASSNLGRGLAQSPHALNHGGSSPTRSASEVARLNESVSAALRERQVAMDKLKKAKLEHTQAESRLKEMYDESLQAREEMVLEMRKHQQAVEQNSREEAERMRLEMAGQKRHMEERVVQLEALLHHKEQAQAILEQQVRMQQQQQGGFGGVAHAQHYPNSSSSVTASTGNFSVSGVPAAAHGPYGRGMRLSTAPLSRGALQPSLTAPSTGNIVTMGVGPSATSIPAGIALTSRRR